MAITTVKIEFPSLNSVIKDLGLNRTGDVQQYATHRARIRMGRHVPRRTGVLEETAYEDYDGVVYPQIYARPMYFGLEFNFNEAPQRGAFWDKKMIADQGNQFENDIQTYVDKRRG